MDIFLQMLSLSFALFLLLDPIGNVPIFISLLKKISPAQQRKIIMRELLIALGIIIAFEYLGDGLLSFLKVQMHTILISGGIILFLIALKMIFPHRKERETEFPLEKEPFIVPLATPLMAGPAVLAAIMLYSGQQNNQWILNGAIIIAWIASGIILISATALKKLLGQRGLFACERLMGLILTLVAVQMFFEGLHLFLQTT